MALLGFGILLATISFFCYKNPPASWSLIQWLRQRTNNDAAISAGQDTGLDEAARVDTKGHPAVRQTKEEKEAFQPETQSTLLSTKSQVTEKAIQDRKAMPHPPVFLSKPSTIKSPSPPDTPKAVSSSSAIVVPSFNLNSEPESEAEAEPTSQFPALNSAQRASGPSSSSSTRMGPPTLAPVRAQPPLRTTNPGPNTGLMLPPTRSPLPNRAPTARASPSGLMAPPSSAQGLAPPPTHSSIPNKPRQKVQLTPGHSPLDWATLTRDPRANLSGLPPGTSYLRVPPSLLKQFSGRLVKQPDGTRRRTDAWTVLSGKVYNITPYADYHPGGVEELMKCAGRDGTKLFGEVHPWVNWEGMLEGCLVGVAVTEDEFLRLKKKEASAPTGEAVGELEEMD